MTRSRTRLAVLAFLSLLAGGVPAAADGPPPPPTRAERAAYWLDRIASGPEVTTYPIRNLHQAQLDDAVANLVAVPEETLTLLADPARRERLQTQDDSNPWHAVLEVLRQIGAARPDVVRAWTLPAFDRPLMTLRRAAVPPLSSLRSAEDAPALLAVLERDADDRVVGPTTVRALLALGPPWDAAAARVAFERGVADAPGGGGGLWDPLAEAMVESKSPAVDDLLAWWASLAAVAGPRAKPPQGKRAREGSPAAAYASVEDLVGIGRGAAARARASLALRGHAFHREALERDAKGPDPAARRVAREALWRLTGKEGLPAFRAETKAFLDALAGTPAPPQDAIEEAGARVRVLKEDPDPQSGELLVRFVFETPPSVRVPRLAAYDALAAREAAPVSEVVRLLASGEPAAVDRALELVKHSGDRAYVRPLLAWADGPRAGARRPHARRIWVFLVAHVLAHGGLDPEELGEAVRKVLDWSKDPADPSASGLLATLLELGAPGLAAVADGLRGPDRETYLALLQKRTVRPLPPAVVDAVLAPLGRDTPAPERRRALDAAFSVAGGDSAEGLRAAARRMGPPGAAEAETVARIVAHRTASER